MCVCWEGGRGEEALCNILEFYLVRFPSAVVNNRTSFSFHLLRGNGLRIEWTCTLCFPYLGLWETGLHLGFGSKHIHASHLTKEFGFGLHYFLLLNDKSLGVVV